MTNANYTFKQKCDCGNKPVLKGLDMCSVCTFGEASSMWDVWGDEADDPVTDLVVTDREASDV